MVVDGQKIASDIYTRLRVHVAQLGQAPRLAVITCAPNFETQKFLGIKQRKAEEIGVELSVIELPETATSEVCVAAIRDSAKTSDGIVVQLPFPQHIDRDALIAAIPQTHDVDAFVLDDVEVLPPVVGAMAEIVAQYRVSVSGKRVVVVGDGLLVGAPAARWFLRQGADVTTVTRESGSIEEQTREADIIVLGAGVLGLLQPHMVKEGAIILDAGTSEEGGELRGDADPQCAEKAALFTPVPGGIGPITVAVLLENLVTLASRK